MVLKLKASARESKHYILFEADSAEIVLKAIEDGLGSLGMSKAGLVIASKEPIILAINRKSVIDIRAACEMSKENISIKRVSGTLKGLGK